MRIFKSQHIFLYYLLSLTWFSCWLSACTSYQVADDKIYPIPTFDNLSSNTVGTFLADATQDYPDNAEIFYQKALYHLKKQEDSLALQAIQKAISLDNLPQKYYFILGKSFQALRQYDKALIACQTALKNNENHLDLQLCLAELYLSKKKYDKALEHLSNAEKITPLDARTYYLHGSLALEKLDSARAIANLNKAIASRKNYKEAYATLAKVYNIFEMYATALQVANKGLKFANNYDMLNYQKAEAFRFLRYYEDSAKVYYQKAYNSNPELYGASYQIGLYFFKKGKTQEANQYFLATLKHNPQWANANYYAGVTFAYLNKNEKALPYLEKTIKLDPLNYAANDLYWGLKNQIELANMQRKADSLQRLYYEQQEKMLKQLQQQIDSANKKQQTPQQTQQ